MLQRDRAGAATAPRPLRGLLGRRRPSGLAEAAVGAEDKTRVAGKPTRRPWRHRRFGGIHQWEGVRTLRPSFTRVEE